MKVTKKREQGFTLLEALIVVGIMAILMGITIIGSMGPMQNYKANAALDVVSSQLRVAREISITQRRDVQITVETGQPSDQLPGDGASTEPRRKWTVRS